MAHLRDVSCQADNAESGMNPLRKFACLSCCHEVDSEEAARYREGEGRAKYTPSFQPTTSRSVACWSRVNKLLFHVGSLRGALDKSLKPIPPAKDEQSEEPAAILWLPDDLLLGILLKVLCDVSMYPTMYRLQMVCRRFYRLCQDQALWRRVDVANWGVRWLPHRDSTLLWLVDHRLPRTLREINLNGWHCLTGHGLTHLLDSCPQLEELYLESCRALGPTTLPLVMQHCRSLTSINLADVHHSVVCGSHLLTLISTLGHQLTRLGLRNNKLCSFSALMDNICAHCPNLEELDLGKSFGDRLVLDVNKWQTCLPRLGFLYMEFTAFADVEVVERSRYAPHGWPVLQILLVAGLPGMCDDILKRMISKSPHLWCLDIRDCHQLSSRAFTMMTFPKLRHLLLTDFSDSLQSGLAVLLRRYGPHLESLYLSHSVWSNAPPKQSRELLVNGLHRCMELRRLYLDNTKVSSHLVWHLVSVIPTSVTTLDLRHCPGLPSSLRALHNTREKICKLKRYLDSLYRR